MGAISGSGASLGTLWIEIQARVDEAVRSLQNFGNETARIIDEQKSNLESLGDVGGKLSGLGLGLTAAITAPLALLGKASIDAAGDMQSLTNALNTVTGSSTETATQLARLKEIAKLPGLGLEEAVKGSLALQAVGVSAQDAERYLKAFGNAIAAAGGGRADLEAVVVQLRQMGATGKVTAEDLKPILERVPQVAAVTKAAFGSINTEDLKAKGVDAQTFLNTIVAGLEKIPPVTGGIKNAMENLSDSTKTAFAALGETMVPVIERLTPLLETMIGWVTKAAEWFGQLPAPVQAFAGTLIALAAALGPILLTFGGMATAISALMPALTGLAAFFGTSVVALGGWAAAIGLVVAALVALGTWVYQNWDSIVNTFKKGWNALIDVVQDFLKWAGKIPGVNKAFNFDQAAKNLQGFRATIETTAKSTDKLVTSTTQAAVPLPKLGDAAKKAGEGLDKTAKSAKETTDSFKPLHERSAVLDAMAQQLQSNYNKLAAQVAAAKLAAADMTRQTELLIPPTQELTDLVARSNTEFKNLAKVHVPEAIQALGQAKTSTEGITKATDGLDTGLKKVGSTSKEVADNSKLNLDSMKRGWETFGTEVSTIVTNFTQDIAKSLFEGDTSWGEKAKGMLKSLGEAVTSSFIQPATAALTSFINGAIADLLGGKGLGGVLDGIKGIGGAFSGIFGGGAKAAGDAAGSAFDMMDKAGGAAGDVAGKAAGMGVSQIAGIATGAISAVTGVIGAFQMKGMNKSLDLIVLHTLQIANDMFNLRRDEWDRFEGSAYSMMGRMGELLMELRIIQPDVSLMRMSVQAIEANIGAGQATLEAMLNLDRDTAQQQKSLTEVMIERLDRLAMGFERLLGLTEKQITMNLYGTDPTLVESKIAGSARLQGVLA